MGTHYTKTDRSYIDPEVNPDIPKEASGVCVYIKSEIQHGAFDLSHVNKSCQYIEIQCIRIEKPNNKEMVLIYRPPKGDKAEITFFLLETLENIPGSNKLEIILTGHWA